MPNPTASASDPLKVTSELAMPLPLRTSRPAQDRSSSLYDSPAATTTPLPLRPPLPLASFLSPNLGPWQSLYPESLMAPSLTSSKVLLKCHLVTRPSLSTVSKIAIPFFNSLPGSGFPQSRHHHPTVIILSPPSLPVSYTKAEILVYFVPCCTLLTPQQALPTHLLSE